MKKIKYYQSILISIFAIILINVSAYAQTSDELFKKVFGDKHSEVEESLTKIDATIGDFFVGEVSVKLAGETLEQVSGADIFSAISDKVREKKKESYHFLKEMIDPALLPFKVIYHPAELRLTIHLPSEDLKPNEANVFEDQIPYYSRNAVEPANMSFSTNYKLEQSFYKNLNQQDNFYAQTDSFLTIKKISIENQMTYLSSREQKLTRQNTKALYDRPSRMQRIEVGDVGFPIIGYQQGLSLGGASFYRDFSLNPYRQTTPTSSFEYVIDNRSLVKTFVNNILLKTEYMNAGRYQVKDIPLNNGLNKILVEITDDLGKVKVLTFNESGSLDLLAKEMSRYSISAGLPSTDGAAGKNYSTEDGVLVTSFYQYGYSKNWTTSAYYQGNEKYQILGTNQIFSTVFGNFSNDLVTSKNKEHSGLVSQLTYQLNLFGAYWYDSHNLTTKVEYRSPFFNESGALIRNRFDFTTSLSYSVPLFEKINAALGGSFQNPTLALNSKISLNASLTAKMFNASSLTFYAARSRDEFKFWSNQLYLFFNMTFGDNSTFASAFYEKESQTKRLTVIRDSGKKYNDLKLSAVADQNISSKSGALDMQYNTVLADVGARQEVIKNAKSEGFKTSVRFLSSFSYVYTGTDHGFSISRPISNSFVIFKPNEGWNNQKFGVQSSSDFKESSSGLFGESILSGLTPYQYKRVQLDPSQLEPGYALGQESYILYPRRNTGHLFKVGESGYLVLKGNLVSTEGKPLSLKVGQLINGSGKKILFFTDREGFFFIEGVEASLVKIILDGDGFEEKEINLSTKEHGLLDLGVISLKGRESQL